MTHDSLKIVKKEFPQKEYVLYLESMIILWRHLPSSIISYINGECARDKRDTHSIIVKKNAVVKCYTWIFEKN